MSKDITKNLASKQDLVIIGGGTSGVSCAIGALRYGLKVTLICNTADFAQSSLLSEIIPSKAFVYSAGLAFKIKQAKLFGLDVNLAPINMVKVNSYVQNIVQELKQENDLEIFEKLGGVLLIGTARFINKYTVEIGNININSKYFVLATGTRNAASSIINFEQADALLYSSIFHKNTLAKNTIILGSSAESLEMAQALARFGSKVTIICSKSKLLPADDQELVKKLQILLEQENIIFYLSTNVLEFYWQNQRKNLVCQDSRGDKFIVDGEEIIDLRDLEPNVAELALQNTGVQYSQEGILVNNRLQTKDQNIFAVGSVVKSPFKSLHLIEQQVNVILSNIVFKISRKINYKLIPRVLFTCPQFAAVGITSVVDLDPKVDQTKIKILQFNFSNIDAAIYQKQKVGEVKLLCNGDKLLGASILGPLASELIAEYSFAMQVGAGVSEIANNIHAYPALSQINKRVAHKVFDHTTPSTTTVAIEKAKHKMHQMAAMWWV